LLDLNFVKTVEAFWQSYQHYPSWRLWTDQWHWWKAFCHQITENIKLLSNCMMRDACGLSLQNDVFLKVVICTLHTIDSLCPCRWKAVKVRAFEGLHFSYSILSPHFHPVRTERVLGVQSSAQICSFSVIINSFRAIHEMLGQTSFLSLFTVQNGQDLDMSSSALCPNDVLCRPRKRSSWT